MSNCQMLESIVSDFSNNLHYAILSARPFCTCMNIEVFPTNLQFLPPDILKVRTITTTHIFHTFSYDVPIESFHSSADRILANRLSVAFRFAHFSRARSPAVLFERGISRHYYITKLPTIASSPSVAGIDYSRDQPTRQHFWVYYSTFDHPGT